MYVCLNSSSVCPVNFISTGASSSVCGLVFSLHKCLVIPGCQVSLVAGIACPFAHFGHEACLPRWGWGQGAGRVPLPPGPASPDLTLTLTELMEQTSLLLPPEDNEVAREKGTPSPASQAPCSGLGSLAPSPHHPCPHGSLLQMLWGSCWLPAAIPVSFPSFYPGIPSVSSSLMAIFLITHSCNFLRHFTGVL